MHAPPSPAPRELVLFLPAVGGDSSFWAPQVEALAGAYEVRALDFTRPAAEVSIEAYADDVAAAIAAAGFACAHVVGCSMGGVVALALAARHPRRVRSLTLVASWAHQADGAARLAWFEGELSQKTVAEFSQATMPALFAPATDPALVARCVARESAKDHAVYRASWRAMLTADMRPALPTLSAPLLLVGGALDPVTPADPLLTDIAAAVPTARLEVLAAGSHFLNLDCPAAFNELLRGHLRGAKARVSDRLTPVEPGAWTLPATATATQLIALLGQRGVELLAANSGTDFTPIIEAYAELSDAPGPLPRLVQCPHEATAIALAHGHALISRRAQAVMGHVGVGTANMGLGIINARRAQVPMLVLAGRTPHYEEGLPGVRTNFVQWGQDTRDQGAYFREFTRWDYELRGPHALDTVIDRALAIAESDPRGPVYLTLPKEPLCAPAPARTIAVEPAQEVAHAGPADALALARARTWIAASRRTLVITADVGRHVGAPEALVRFSRAARAGVVEFGKRNFFNFPTEDPHHLGFDPHALLADVELVIAIECPVPWIPAFAGGARPRTIQLGVDPLCADLPMRGFPCDLALAGDPVATLRALAEGGPTTPDPALARRHATIFDEARHAARADATREVITKRYLSHMIGQVIDDDVIIVNEYNLDPTQVPRRCADSWFENSVASGLGWSLGAALGIKLAARERTVVTTLGDGSYLFNAPLSAHYVAADLAIPTLTVIFNDRAWSTIKKSTRGGHPGGFADRSGQFALCDFGHALDFAAIAAACGLSGRRVTAPAELRAALEGALADVRAGASVLVDVACERDA